MRKLIKKMSSANNKQTTTNSNNVGDNRANENKTTDTSEEEADAEEEDTEDSDYSEASLTSEKIIIASKEKRLQQRIMGLQASIENLKKQLKSEKEKWQQNMKELQEMQQRYNNQDHIRYQHYCGNRHTPSELSRAESTSSLFHNNLPNRKCEQFARSRSIKQLLEIEEYKRKLNETENMCNMELLRVKRSLADLFNLQAIASEWTLNDDSNRIIGENNDGALSGAAAGADGEAQDVCVGNRR